MNRTSERVHAFIEDVNAGVSDSVLQQRYGVSGKRLLHYKGAAWRIIAGLEATQAKPVRRIDARPFLADIQSGIGENALMVKYNVSQRQLQKLYGKAISVGLVTPGELSQWLAVHSPRVSQPRRFWFNIGWKKLAVPLVAILVTVGSLWLTNYSVTPKEATWDDVLSEAKAGGYHIIGTDELKKKYEQDLQNITLVDTRQDWEFNQGHIRGAVNFPLEPTWWSRWRKSSLLEALLGPDKNRFIVFY